MFSFPSWLRGMSGSKSNLGAQRIHHRRTRRIRPVARVRFERLEDRSLLTGIPALHSLPGAPAAIYLDFDGYGPGPTWDSGWAPVWDGHLSRDANGNPVYGPGYDPAVIDEAEDAAIREDWRQISNYLAPLRIDVTTVKPDMYVTPTSWTYYNNLDNWSSVGIFPATDGGGGTGAGSHNGLGLAGSVSVGGLQEILHDFGTPHQSVYRADGTRLNEYFVGYDNSTPSAPFMGYGNNQGEVKRFYYGHPSWSIANSTETTTTPAPAAQVQDDLAYVAGKIVYWAQQRGFPASAYGDGFRLDDYTSPTPLALNGAVWELPADHPSGVSAWSKSGIIEKLTDIDEFTFTTPSTPSTAYYIGLDRAANASTADLKLELYAGGTLVAALDDPNAYDAQLVLPLAANTAYTIKVMSHGDYGDVGVYTLAVRPWAAGWETEDARHPQVPGYAQYDAASGQFTLAGSGNDWAFRGYQDTFRYAYQNKTGDASIAVYLGPDSISRPPDLTSNAAVQDFAEVGVMIREKPAAGGSLNDPSKFVMVALTPAGAEFMVRDGIPGYAGGPANDITTQILTGTWTTPVWLKLERVGNALTAYRSDTGLAGSWTQVGSTTLTMTADVTVGMAIGTFRSAWPESMTEEISFTKRTTAVFSNVTAEGSSPSALPLDTLPAPAWNSGFPTQDTSTTGIKLKWNSVSNASGYRVERSTDRVHWQFVVDRGTNNSQRTYTDNPTPALFGSMRYFYRIRTLGSNDTSISDPSTADSLNKIAVITNRPPVPSFDLGSHGEHVPPYETVTIPPVVTWGSKGGLTLNWRDVAGETGYEVWRSTSTSPSSFAKITALPDPAANVTTYTDTTAAQGQTYYYKVLAKSSVGNSPLSAYVSGTTLPLPSPWLAGDIGGGLYEGGRASYAGTTHTVKGVGIFDSGQFHYVYQPRTDANDWEIVAKVASQENNTGWDTAGVMIRENLLDNSKFVFMGIKPTGAPPEPAKQYVFQGRAAAGGNMTSAAAPATGPYWVKVVKRGSNFLGFTSADGNNWTLQGYVAWSGSVPSTLYVGLANGSNNRVVSSTATFTDVLVGPEIETTGVPIPDFPSGWAASDIGPTSPPGYSGYSATPTPTYTVSGSGDIGSTADKLHFTYRTLTGGGYIQARVTGQSTSNPANKAGVMFRNSLDNATGNDKSAFIGITPASGLVWQNRTTVGGASTGSSITGPAAPYWVKVERLGDTVTTWSAPDNSGTPGTWTQRGAATVIDMEATAYVGLAVSNANGGTLNTATFDNVSVIPYGLPLGWQNSDVPSGVTGSASFTDIPITPVPTYTVQGAKTIYWDDGYHFAFKSLNGTVASVVARVASIGPGDPNSMAGVMIRESLAANSKFATIGIAPNSWSTITYRDESGFLQQGHSWGGRTIPFWVKLVRNGDTITAWSASDNAGAPGPWEERQSFTMTGMGDTALYGLVVDNAGYASTSTAAFTNVDIQEAILLKPSSVEFSFLHHGSHDHGSHDHGHPHGAFGAVLASEAVSLPASEVSPPVVVLDSGPELLPAHAHDLSMHEHGMHDLSMHDLSMHDLSMHDLSMHDLSMHDLSMHDHGASGAMPSLDFLGSNSQDPLDVNDDAHVSPMHALLIINALHEQSISGLDWDAVPTLLRLDTNRYNVLSPLDPLLVINRLNEPASGQIVAPEDADAHAAVFHEIGESTSADRSVDDDELLSLLTDCEANSRRKRVKPNGRVALAS